MGFHIPFFQNTAIHNIKPDQKICFLCAKVPPPFSHFGSFTHPHDVCTRGSSLLTAGPCSLVPAACCLLLAPAAYGMFLLGVVTSHTLWLFTLPCPALFCPALHCFALPCLLLQLLPQGIAHQPTRARESRSSFYLPLLTRNLPMRNLHLQPVPPPGPERELGCRCRHCS